MAIRKIIRYPLPSLRWPTRAVTFPLSDDVFEHIKDLQETLITKRYGLGLASNQILERGCRIFIFATWTQLFSVFDDGILINPTWSATAAGVSNVQESCLSIPDQSFVVRRYDNIVLDYHDVAGSHHTVELHGLLSQATQHECDHLDGKLLVDLLDNKQRAEAYRVAVKNRISGK